MFYISIMSISIWKRNVKVGGLIYVQYNIIDVCKITNKSI